MEPPAAAAADIASADNIARVVFALYDSLPPKGKPQAREWTVLAAIVATTRSGSAMAPDITVLSLGVGNKCLPEHLVQAGGTQVFDSHAEVLARRAFQLFLLKEIETAEKSSLWEPKLGKEALDSKPNNLSLWIEKAESGKWRMQQHVRLHLYVSHTLCGDAAIFNDAEPTRKRSTVLASMSNSSKFTLQHSFLDTTAAALSSVHSSPHPPAAKRSRAEEATTGELHACIPRSDHNSATGVLRTKPGRGEPTHCMSCSDKFARWMVLGLQGALISHLLEPVYLDSVVLSEMYNNEALTRALVQRTEGIKGPILSSAVFQDLIRIDLPPTYRRAIPRICSSSLFFSRGQRSVAASVSEPVSSGAALNWALNANLEVTLAASGRLFGSASLPRSFSRLCKASKYRAFLSLYSKLLPNAPPFESYRAAKQAVLDYYKARSALHSLDAFREWPARAIEWESFS